jgi:hypothetical protein
MSKVKVNPKYPDNPGMVDSKFRFNTLDWDMLDDTSRFPTKHDLEQSPQSAGSELHAKFGTNDWEDLAGIYRADRNNMLEATDNYNNALIQRIPFHFGGEFQFQFQTLSVGEYGPWDTPQHEKFYFTFPSMEDGSNNYPLMYAGGTYEKNPYPYVNSNMSYKEIAFKVLPSLKFRDIYPSILWNELESLRLISEFAGNLARVTTDFEGNPSVDKYYAKKSNFESIINLKLSKAREASVGTYVENGSLLDEEIANRESYHSSLVFDYLSSYDEPLMMHLINAGSPGNPSTWFEPDTQGNPTRSLADLFGEAELHWLPGVRYEAELTNIQGQVGQCINVSNGGDYAWDHINGEWSAEFYEAYFSIIRQFILWRNQGNGQTSVNSAVKDITLSIKPFAWAVHHFPCLWIFDGIKTSSEKTVADFATLNS